MSDTKTGDEKTLSVNTEEDADAERPGIEQGTVRQNFSHGRAKSVVVETKKRKFAPPDEKPAEVVFAVAAVQPKPQPPRPGARTCRSAAAARAARRQRSGMVLNELSTERDRSAPPGARGSEGPRGRGAPVAPPTRPRRAEDEERRRREREESARRQAEEEARLQPRPSRAAAPRKRRAAARRSVEPSQRRRGGREAKRPARGGPVRASGQAGGRQGRSRPRATTIAAAAS